VFVTRSLANTCCIISCAWACAEWLSATANSSYSSSWSSSSSTAYYPMRASAKSFSRMTKRNASPTRKQSDKGTREDQRVVNRRRPNLAQVSVGEASPAAAGAAESQTQTLSVFEFPTPHRSTTHLS